MPRYVYTGPEGQRGIVPSWAFDDGVLAPDHVAALTARGHLRDLSEAAPEAAPEEDAAHPKPRTRRAARS